MKDAVSTPHAAGKNDDGLRGTGPSDNSSHDIDLVFDSFGCSDDSGLRREGNGQHSDRSSYRYSRGLGWFYSGPEYETR